MVESKCVLYSLLAAVIAGTLSSVMILFKLNSSEEFVREFAYQQLLSSGLPEGKASEIVKTVIDAVRALLWLAPIGPVVNMLFLGALLGMLLDFLIGMSLPIVPSLVYTILLTIFSSIKGPWTKWGEARPEVY